MSSVLLLLVLSHGAYPIAYQVEETPADRTQLLAGTTFGLLLSRDDGASWHWVCEEAIGYGSGYTPVWRITPTGAILGATFKGLYLSRDVGCTFASNPEFTETGVADLASSGSALFAVSGIFGYTNHVWRSKDDAMSWAKLPVQSDTEFYTTVRTAPSRPERIYVGGWWYKPEPTEVLYVSDDEGDSFSRIDVTPKLPTLTLPDGGSSLLRGAFFVLAVDPNSPDHFYAVVKQDADPQHSFLFESFDRGATFLPRLDSPDEITQVALSADAGEIWAATRYRLLVARAEPDAGFVALDVPSRQSCVQRFSDRTYVCGWPEADGFAVAREVGEGALTPLLTWQKVESVAACPATSPVTKVCTGFFSALVAQFPGLEAPDAGPAPDAGMMPPEKPTGCHCSAGPMEVSLTLLLALCRFASAHALRRRRIHR